MPCHKGGNGGPDGALRLTAHLTMSLIESVYLASSSSQFEKPVLSEAEGTGVVSTSSTNDLLNSLAVRLS